MRDDTDWRVVVGNHWSEQFGDKPFLFVVGDGWSELLFEVLVRVDAALEDEEREIFAWSDIKEKFGVLAMSHNGGERVERIVDWAEVVSERICDQCGMAGRLRNRDGWRKVRCNDCAGK